MKKFYVLSLGIGALLLAIHDAQASPACLPHAEIVERLAAKYGERRQSIGIGNRNTVVEIFCIRHHWNMDHHRHGGRWADLFGRRWPCLPSDRSRG